MSGVVSGWNRYLPGWARTERLRLACDALWAHWLNMGSGSSVEAANEVLGDHGHEPLTSEECVVTGQAIAAARREVPR